MDVGKFVHVYAFLARMSGETSEEKIETAVAYCRLVKWVIWMSLISSSLKIYLGLDSDDIDNLWNNGRITEQIGLFTDPRCPPFQWLLAKPDKLNLFLITCCKCISEFGSISFTLICQLWLL